MIPIENNIPLEQLDQDINGYKQWLFENVQNYIQERTIELVSAQGGISSMFVDHKISLHLSDPQKPNRDRLRESFSDSPYIKSVRNVDLLRPNFGHAHRDLLAKFRTVVFLNAHLYSITPEIILNRSETLLKPAGILIFILPSQTVFLYKDQSPLEELKQFNMHSINHLLAGRFILLKARYFTLHQYFKTSKYTNAGPFILAILRKSSNH